MGNTRNIIGQNIKRFCEDRNMKFNELAAKLGVKPSAVSNWINGTNSIDIEKLVNLCDILNVTLNDIYGITIDKKTGVSFDALEVAQAYDQAEPHIRSAIRTILKLDAEEMEERKNA